MSNVTQNIHDCWPHAMDVTKDRKTNSNIKSSFLHHLLHIVILAGLPGFARDSCSIIMSICAFHFYIIYFLFFSADHGIPQTFDYILTT